MSSIASAREAIAPGRALKRVFDVAVAGAALIVLLPLLAVIAVVVRLSSPGPVLYGALRVGRGGRTYRMHKFRTMHHLRPDPGPRITGTADHRVVTGGRLLRKSKLDELPQLWNVVRGEMSIVGPRPEDPEIVEEHYTPVMIRTLMVRPGLTSPGSIYGTTHGEGALGGDDPVRAYSENLLPVKLALEQVYLERQSFLYDLRIIGRTVVTMVEMGLGRRQFPDPPEMERARTLLAAGADVGNLSAES
jgi:lipopolysaccharide/colanic/teichoic acid biosynthesis glycosyltransferase